MNKSSVDVPGIYPRTREQKELEKAVAEIQSRRKVSGRQEIRDVAEFTAQLLVLANTYRTLRQGREEAEVARKRYSDIGKLAEKLLSAMNSMSVFERERLCDAQLRLFHNFTDLNEDALTDRDDLFRSGYKSRNFWHATEDLAWLAAGAKSLCKSRPRSRPQDSIEKRIAKLFVVLCHQHGWSHIGVSRWGTESKGVLRPTDSVLCFAAVLEAGGCRYESKAATALESLRDEFEYVVGPTWVKNGVITYDSEECEIYIVNLRKMVRKPSGLDLLPRFAPDD